MKPKHHRSKKTATPKRSHDSKTRRQSVFTRTNPAPPEMRAKAHDLQREKKSRQAIASELGVSKTTIERWLNKPRPVVALPPSEPPPEPSGDSALPPPPLPPHQGRRRKFGPDHPARIRALELFDKGLMTRSAIAREVGVYEPTLHRWLGKKERTDHQVGRAVQKRQVAKLHAEGMRAVDIAARYGVSSATIHNWLKTVEEGEQGAPMAPFLGEPQRSEHEPAHVLVINGAPYIRLDRVAEHLMHLIEGIFLKSAA